MQVILKEDVDGLGCKDDIIEVAQDFARDILFPYGLAQELRCQRSCGVRIAKLQSCLIPRLFHAEPGTVTP